MSDFRVTIGQASLPVVISPTTAIPAVYSPTSNLAVKIGSSTNKSVALLPNQTKDVQTFTIGKESLSILRASDLNAPSGGGVVYFDNQTQRFSVGALSDLLDSNVVLSTRSIATTLPLQGGGDLTDDLSLSIAVATDVTSGIVPGLGGSTSTNAATVSQITPLISGIASLETNKVDISGDTLTGPLRLSRDPVYNNEAATKDYVDNLSGLARKDDVRIATTVHIVTSGLITIDAVVLNNGDRVLVKNQNNPVQNGIYIASPSSWTRATDFDIWSNIVLTYIRVTSGSSNTNSEWVSNVITNGTVNVDQIHFSEFNVGTVYTAGTGVTIVGNVISANVDISGLATVATTGSYNDLIDKPSLTTATYSNTNGTTTCVIPTGATEHFITINFSGAAGSRMIEFYSPSYVSGLKIKIRYIFGPTNITVTLKSDLGATLDTLTSDGSGDDAILEILYTTSMQLEYSIYPAQN